MDVVIHAEPLLGALGVSYWGHMKFIARSSALVLAFALPAVALAIDFSIGANSNGGFFFGIGSSGSMGGGGLYCGTSSICGVANTFLYLINRVLVPLLFAVSFIVFLYGIAKAYIFKHGVEEVESGHQLLLWGLAGFVIMISVWGLVNVIANTFGLAGYGAPRLPTSI